MRAARPGVRTLLGAAAVVGLLTSGCASGFYISESDFAALHANLRTERAANDLLGGFQDRLITIVFRQERGEPRIERSDILETLRAVPNLWALDQVLGVLRLAELSRQLEAQLGEWIADEMRGLRSAGARLDPLRSITVRVTSAPVVSFDASLQRIRFELRVGLTVRGRLVVTDPDDSEDLQGVFPVTIAIADLRLSGVLSQPSVDMVRLGLRPDPRRIIVDGPRDAEVRFAIRRLVSRKLSVPLTAARYLRFDNFGLARMRLHGVGEAAEATLEVTYVPRPEFAPPVLEVVVRGEDGRLFHGRRQSGAWAAFDPVPLPGPIAGDPALVVSRPDQLELVAVAASGEMLYAGWRGGTWGQFFRSGSEGQADAYAAARPALVATAPGQLEVVALGRDGQLRHLRRLAGRWQPPQRVADPGQAALPPLRDPSAVLAGTKLVVVYADSRDRLFAAAFDLETRRWGQPQAIGTRTIRFAPAAASCGEGQIDLLYAGGDGLVYHRTVDLQAVHFRPGVATTGLSVGSERGVPGTRLTGPPAVTCSGYRQLEVAGRGQDNQLRHNRLLRAGVPARAADGREIAAGWQGWKEVRSRFFGTLLIGAFSETLALTATRTGQVHLAVRAADRQNRPTVVLHNSYDGTRDVAAPARAVHWRGHDRASRSRFVGGPALAAWSRQLEVAAVGGSAEIWHASLPDRYLPRFRRTLGTQVLFSADPVQLSTGPGTVDVLFLGHDGRPRHVRQMNGTHDRVLTLALPPSGPIVALTATLFGGDQIAVVGRDGPGALYFWRYFQGSWAGPVTIPTAVPPLLVLSVPVVVHAGGGELVVFVIAGDRQLHRWRLADTLWDGPRPVPAGVPLGAVLFGATAAVAGEGGAIELALAEADSGRLFHGRLPAEPSPTPSGLTRLSDLVDLRFQTGGVPSLAALGLDRFALVAAGPGPRLLGAVGQFRLDLGAPGPQPPAPMLPAPAAPAPGGPQPAPAPMGRVGWSGFEPLSALERVALVGDVVPLGSGQFAVVAAGVSGRIYLSRFVNGGWSALLPLGGQKAPAEGSPPASSRPGLVAH